MSSLKPDGEHSTSTGTGAGSGSGGTLEEEVGLRPRDSPGRSARGGGRGSGHSGPSAPRGVSLAIAPGAFPPLPFGRGGAARVRRAGASGGERPGLPRRAGIVSPPSRAQGGPRAGRRPCVPWWASRAESAPRLLPARPSFSTPGGARCPLPRRFSRMAATPANAGRNRGGLARRAGGTVSRALSTLTPPSDLGDRDRQCGTLVH